MRLKDFASKTTKVVLNGNAELNASIRAEVSARWSISPFEFCSADSFERLKENNAYYFLYFTGEGDIIFLTLSKGGQKHDEDPFRQPFEVVSLPISSEQEKDGEELAHIAACIDILQDFVEKALENESILYGGLKGICRRPGKGADIITRTIPSDTGKGYVLRYDAHTHTLHHYGRTRR